MKSRLIITDPSAETSNDSAPAFIARPEDAPVYHGFCVVDESETDGWRYGAITAFDGVKNEEEGDGFVIAPDGCRAGIAWAIDAPEFEVILPPSEGRWGVYCLRFPKPVSSREDLIENFRAVLPLLKEQYSRIQKGSAAGNPDHRTLNSEKPSSTQRNQPGF